MDRPSPPPPPLRPAAVVLTARMGAGHDGVARELTRRLESRGFTVTVADVWDLQPPGVGRLVTAFYRTVVQRAGWLYELIYRLWLRPPPARRAPISPVTRWAERRLTGMIREVDADVAVTTFHLGAQMLGNLRRRDALAIPTVSVCVDFAAHGLWVNPGIDLNLCLHPLQARRLAWKGARDVVVGGPLVDGRFHPDPYRRAVARRRLGLAPSQPAALLVGGSWGAGRLAASMAALQRIEGLRILAVTGDNDRLRRRLERDHPEAVVVGWTDEMDDLMLAADVVIDNAGGLTAMEALATGTPVIGFLPIPGHGRENVAAMAEAGVSRVATGQAELDRVVRDLTRHRSGARRRSVVPAAAEADPVEAICALARRPTTGATAGGPGALMHAAAGSGQR